MAVGEGGAAGEGGGALDVISRGVVRVIHPEIQTGMCTLQDNYWTLRVVLDALRGLLPCDSPTCDHPLVKMQVDNRGSFVFVRACHAWQQRHTRPGFKYWADFAPGQKFSFDVGMIDKAFWLNAALTHHGLRVRLCAFHAYKAILEWYVQHNSRLALLAQVSAQ